MDSFNISVFFPSSKFPSIIIVVANISILLFKYVFTWSSNVIFSLTPKYFESACILSNIFLELNVSKGVKTFNMLFAVVSRAIIIWYCFLDSGFLMKKSNICDTPSLATSSPTIINCKWFAYILFGDSKTICLNASCNVSPLVSYSTNFDWLPVLVESLPIFCVFITCVVT